MKRYTHISLLVGVAILSGLLPGRAQTPKELPKANPPAPVVFQFGGGDLNQFLTKLRDQFGKEVYEMIQLRGADPDRIQVPKMKLQSVVRDSLFADSHKL